MTALALLSLIASLAASPEPLPSAVPRKPAPLASCRGIDQLGWLAGSWGGSDGKLEMEEQWTAVKGATLLGLHRDVAGARTVGFEFLRIEETADGLVYQAQPSGRAPVPFRCVELAPGRVVFANPEHDFPSRILYWKGEEDTLHARVEGTAGGEARAEEWRWQRAR